MDFEGCNSSVHIDIIFCDICCDEISSGDRRIKTNKFLTDFQVKMNITVTLFGKRISGKLLYEK